MHHFIFPKQDSWISSGSSKIDGTSFTEQNFGQDSKYSLSSSKVRLELNWKPRISLQVGIEEMITWVDNNWSEISKMPLEYIHKK